MSRHDSVLVHAIASTKAVRKVKIKPIAWILLPANTQRKLMHSKMTVGEFMKRYSQPTWCKFPDALEGGTMGCCSLFVPGLIRAYKDCVGCNCRSQENPEQGVHHERNLNPTCVGRKTARRTGKVSRV